MLNGLRLNVKDKIFLNMGDGLFFLKSSTVNIFYFKSTVATTFLWNLILPAIDENSPPAVSQLHSEALSRGAAGLPGQAGASWKSD